MSVAVVAVSAVTDPVDTDGRMALVVNVTTWPKEVPSEFDAIAQ